MARQSVAIAVLATQVIVPVKFPGEGDHWGALHVAKAALTRAITSALVNG